jgi:Flp pilus assembly protein TadB
MTAAAAVGGPWVGLAWSLAAAALLVWPTRSPAHSQARSLTRATGDSRSGSGDESATRVTARTPSLALAIRHSSGRAGDWLGMLTGAAVGAATLAVAGLAAAPLAILAVPAASRLAGRVSQRTPDRRGDPALPLTLDLLAAALRSGRPLSVALRIAAPAAGPANAAALGRVAGLLELGADPAAACASVDDPYLLPVSLAIRRSADSGARLARGLEQLATDLRQQARTTAQERAYRAGVLAMLPLGLCFLPAFICIGVVPVVIGIAGGALAGLR